MRVNNSYLLGLYGGDASGFATSGISTPAPKSQPTAPWSGSVAGKQPTASEILRKAMGSSRFIDESANKLDLRTQNAREYKTLFAMHTGLQMLEALSLRAMEKSVTKADAATLQKRFDAGLKEISDYLATAGSEVNTVRLVNGVSSTRSQGTTVVPRDNHVYHTGPIHSGSLSQEVDAYKGDVRFNITIRTSGGTRSIAIDLDEMGSTPRTLDAVIGHINGKLQTAGVETRFSRQEVPGEAKTMTVGNKTITLPSTNSSWGMTITGTASETVGFQAVETRTSVNVIQGFGVNKSAQSLKFDPSGDPTTPGIGETNWVDGRVDQSSLPQGIKTVRASAAASDGGTWIVADVSDDTNGHSVRGQSDVVLMKLDSAGQVVISRGLGAASSASGYAISVADDGRVAVAGSVTGGLVPGQTVPDKGLSDSFVTVFDANGVEQWTQSRGAKAADEATAVSFGADGRVYVSGRSKSAMPGASAVGGWDSYVQTFGENRADNGTVTATSLGVTQFGTVGDDTVQAMTVDGDNLYTAGVENGAFVIRQLRIGTGGAPELISSRNLGAAIGGEIAGIAVSNGKLVVSGMTRNTALDAGTVNNAHAGGTDVFVASLSTDLSASASDRLTYYGGAGEDTAADVKIVDGDVWVTGTWNRDRIAKDTDPTIAYLTRIDAETGAVEWNRTWTGDKQQANPMALSVSANGSSVLDRLGLPSGELVQDVSQKLVDATALRAGDRFYVTNPNTGRKTAVTIDAKDTLQTLATKIETASGRNLKVTVSTNRETPDASQGSNRVLAGGGQYLTITNADNREGALISAGEMGRDALAGLGLEAGFVGKGTDKRKTVGVDLPPSLNLSSADAALQARDYIQSALRAVREAYRAMSPTMLNASKTPTSGSVSPYWSNQIANYQAALARLSG
ncbi:MULTISPECIES: transcriptional regulator [unclassified Brevundimonas]|uniref:transcriptional regulator n=1 Tax=unclassified Brevundimonas TaxID=2622653 RepID=UPI0025BCEF72|nr:MULTISPECIES: transcriptional regulator [unclassified Brevundimonas]